MQDQIRDLVLFMIQMFIWAFLGRALISWLVLFGVRNKFVFQINYYLGVITEPVIAPFRRFIPPLGTIDIKPIVAILSLILLREGVRSF
jgi:YggT family protein